MWYLGLSLVKDPLGPVNRSFLPIKGREKEKQEPIKTPPGGTLILLCSSHADNMPSQPGERRRAHLCCLLLHLLLRGVSARPLWRRERSAECCVFPAASGGGLRWRRAPQGEQSSGGDHRPPAVCHSSLHSGGVQVEQRHTSLPRSQWGYLTCPHVLWSTE